MSQFTIIIGFIFGILSPILCHFHSEPASHISFSMTILFYCILMLILLATLIHRLYITFDESVYRITRIKRFIVYTLFIITCLLFITSIIIYIISFPLTQNQQLSNQTMRSRLDLSAYFGEAAFGAYIITSAFVVSLFAQNMMKLTHSISTSIQDVHSVNRINAKQTNLINKTSRYVSLFSMALFSTTITMICLYTIQQFLDHGTNIRLTAAQIITQIATIDSLINVHICLTLQYQFTTNVYNRYCVWIECVWKRIFIRRTNSELLKKLQQKVQDQMNNNVATESQKQDDKMDRNIIVETVNVKAVESQVIQQNKKCFEYPGLQPMQSTRL